MLTITKKGKWRNEKTKKEIKAQDLLETIQRSKWEWAGYIDFKKFGRWA